MFLLFIVKTKYCYSAARRKEPNVDQPTRTHFVAIFAQCNICQQHASSKFDFSFVQCVDVIIWKTLVYSAPYLLPPCWRRKNFLADIFPSPPFCPASLYLSHFIFPLPLPGWRRRSYSSHSLLLRGRVGCLLCTVFSALVPGYRGRERGKVSRKEPEIER